MANYVNKDNKFEASEPPSRECPHCGAHAQLVPVATPSFDDLTFSRPGRTGMVFRCASCSEPRFVKLSVRSFGDDRVELSSTLVEVERTKERFPLRYLQEPLALALTKPIARERECPWRRAALPRLEEVGKAFRVLYTSRNSAALSAAVLAGLAVSVFPESAIRPGMRVLGTTDGFPALPSFDIGLLRNPHEQSELADALAIHIVQGLDNLADAEAAE